MNTLELSQEQIDLKRRLDEAAEKVFEEDLKENKAKREEVKVSLLGESKEEIRVEYKITTFYDANAFLKMVINDYLNYCKIIYKNYKEVQKIGFYVKTPIIDSYGNKSDQFVVKFDMNRENFEKFNLENLEYSKIYTLFKNECNNFHIESFMEKDITEQDIVYVPEK